MNRQAIQKEDIVWVVAPHADDEILGCGGLLSMSQAVGARTYVLYLTVSGFTPMNGGSSSNLDSRMKEVEAVAKSLNITGYDILFKGEEKHLRLDTVPLADLVNWLERTSAFPSSQIKPTMILLPSPKHNHQDHKAAYEAGLSLVRTNPSFEGDKLCVMAYEVPGTGQTGLPAFQPNVYFELSQDTLERKCSLFSLYESQMSEKPKLRSLHAIRTVAQFRGLDAGYEFAEAYELLRAKFRTGGIDVR